jgi:ATP-dependent helicase HrpB
LLDGLDEWLGPLLAGRRDFSIPAGKLHDALAEPAGLERAADARPAGSGRYRSPAGTSHAIDYAHEGGPTVELRVQALFGLDRHPVIGQPARPLLLSLTSPAGRPIRRRPICPRSGAEAGAMW